MIARFLWPITDDTAPFVSLVKLALDEVPALAMRSHAKLTGPGRFHVARSVDTPGSGRITDWVLIYEAPAEPLPARAYRKAAA